MNWFKDTCNLIGDLAGTVSDLGSDIGDALKKGGEDFIEDPIKYTTDSVKEVTEAAVGKDNLQLLDDLTDIGKELGEDVGNALKKGGEDFIEDPIKYTTDSVKEVTEASVAIITLPIKPVTNLVEGIVDSIRDPVTPIRGSVLYTDLAIGYFEHSGIYLGKGKIVELDGDGTIRIVTPSQFMSGGTGVNIYVSCKGLRAVGSESIAENAESMVGSSRDYSMVLNNCHQFTSGCISNNYENSNNFLSFLKSECEKRLGSDTWRIWDR